ncbi:Alpha/Beta hydrolase protein [Gymnopilus junonius]|uniref:Alpha/Beta hydrolase protein n=1 Tax=Gymnopilus junonius TaxID=109634 RepID=A0A9P5P498_GYMJU|nr:Alpha/Beta hydrolase protein [Gymnopilus junonius]
MTSNDIELQAADEKYLELTDGRSLAYSESGDPSSSSLAIFLHGAFSVGDATQIPQILVEKNVHSVHPTLPGWGASSPRPKDVPYYVTLASDIAELIVHLHPHDLNLKIYLAGYAFGTIPAQMLYGAPFDLFPFGRSVVGCLLFAPFSPFKLHKEYAKEMTAQSYVALGPLSQYVPFNLLPRMSSLYMKSKLQTLEKAETFVREEIFGPMGEEDNTVFDEWREEQGVGKGAVQCKIAKNMCRSVQETWDGFFEMPDVMHTDWGFRPDTLNEDHNRRPILVIGSPGNAMAPDTMAKWLAANYKNCHYRSVSGGHLATLFHMNDMWKDLFAL